MINPEYLLQYKIYTVIFWKYPTPSELLQQSADLGSRKPGKLSTPLTSSILTLQNSKQRQRAMHCGATRESQLTSAVVKMDKLSNIRYHPTGRGGL